MNALVSERRSISPVTGPVGSGMGVLLWERWRVASYFMYTSGMRKSSRSTR
jgi:hypothetical protein